MLDRIVSFLKIFQAWAESLLFPELEGVDQDDDGIFL